MFGENGQKKRGGALKKKNVTICDFDGFQQEFDEISGQTNALIQ